MSEAWRTVQAALRGELPLEEMRYRGWVFGESVLIPAVCDMLECCCHPYYSVKFSCDGAGVTEVCPCFFPLYFDALISTMDPQKQ